MEVRPKADASATVNELDLELLFAKAGKHTVAPFGKFNLDAPTSLGTSNSAPTADVNLSNHVIGFIPNGSWTAFEQHLDSTAYTQCREDKCSIFFNNTSPRPNAGYDTYYIGGICKGAFDFRSGILLNGAVTSGSTLTVDGVDPRLALAVGDTIAVTATADTSVSRSVGVIKSMPDANTIICEDDGFILADNDIVYNVAPITFRFHFEQ